MTNIVVVQFVSDIQTNMDIKYNLTCVTRGPGEAVVTSGLIGAGYWESFIVSTFFFSHPKTNLEHLCFSNNALKGAKSTTIYSLLIVFTFKLIQSVLLKSYFRDYSREFEATFPTQCFAWPNPLHSQHGDTLSAVVVVQFSEAVQTRHDLAYNLTCTVRQPEDITVTSATLGAG